IEDSWGGDITTAIIAHLVGSTKPGYYFTSTDFNSYIDRHVAEDAPTRKKGWAVSSTRTAVSSQVVPMPGKFFALRSQTSLELFSLHAFAYPG
ncbi:MAG: hypothetical protein JSV25_15735, partial [Spirochaetota bacterium]